MTSSPRSQAFFANKPEWIMTLGLDVFVQLVMAAITISPCLSCARMPSNSNFTIFLWSSLGIPYPYKLFKKRKISKNKKVFYFKDSVWQKYNLESNFIVQACMPIGFHVFQKNLIMRPENQKKKNETIEYKCRSMSYKLTQKKDRTALVQIHMAPRLQALNSIEN